MANDFLPFATDPAANVISQGAWSALGARPGGFLSGVATSNQVNKALRQATAMAAAIGAFVDTFSPLSAVDDGNIAALRDVIAQTMQAGSLNYGDATAVGNAWTVTLPLMPPAFPNGFRAWFHAPAVPTGSVTLNVSGGTGFLIGPDGVTVGAGDVILGEAIEVVYLNGVGWQMVTSRLRQFQRANRRQVFLSTSTFTVPAGVEAVTVTVIAGGGGGSASGNGTGGGVVGNSGGGGGGGGFAQKTIIGLVSGAVVPVTVGGGGSAGSGGGTGNGGPGGSSSFGAYCSATGGDGALWGENTLANGGAGGGGIGGDINVQGTDGGCTGPNVSLIANATMSDTHRIYNRGGIAAGGLSTMALGLSTGASGRGFGTGGGGATGGSALAGGAGAPGLVIVEW